MPHSVKKSFLALALAGSSWAANGICRRIDKCVSNHNPSEATAYCSSYLSISTTTTTVGGDTTTVTTTSTSFTSTTTVFDPSLYRSCGTANDKQKRGAAVPVAVAAMTHSKPFCLRHFTEPAGISKGCDCLDIPTPTSTTTAAESTVTSTSTVSAVSTALTDSFQMLDTTDNTYAFSGSGSGSLVFFLSEPGTWGLTDQCNLFPLPPSGSGGTTNVSYVQPGGGNVYIYTPGSEPAGWNIVTCSLSESDNALDCMTSDSNANELGSGGSWKLVASAGASSTFSLQALPTSP